MHRSPMGDVFGQQCIHYGAVEMRWRGRRQSENIEDRRGVKGGAVVGGGITIREVHIPPLPRPGPPNPAGPVYQQP